MATNKIYRLLIIVIIFFWNSMIPAQQKTVADADGYYSKFYASSVNEIDPYRKWILINHRNRYGKNDIEAVNLQTGKGQILPKADNYLFTAANKMILFSAGKTVLFRNLRTNQEKEIIGSYIINVLPDVGKVVLYEKDHKFLLVCDPEGNVLIRKDDLNGVRVDINQNVLLAASAKEWMWLNLSTFDKSVIQIKCAVEWYHSAGDRVWGLSLAGEGVVLSEWDREKKTIREESLSLPLGYKIADEYTLYTQTREDRYLVLPLVKNTTAQSDLVNISYSNKNNSFKLPFRQIAVFDLVEKEWKHLPAADDLFFTQDFVNESGDFIHYDKVSSNRDTLNNYKTQIRLIKNYGEKTFSLRNPYFYKANYNYDVSTDKMLYFEDDKWWIHDLIADTLSASSLPDTAEWRSDEYSGLSDVPRAAAVPWGQKGEYIIQGQFDLYLLNIDRNSWRKLTDGAAKYLRYSIYRSGAGSKIKKNASVIVKIFNTRNFHSGFAYLHPDGKLETLVYGNFVVKDAWPIAKSLLYTTQSYQQPFEIHSQYKKVNKTIYKSEGIVEGKLPFLRKKLFQYTLQSGKNLNAVLLFPYGYDANKKYPLVVNVYEDRTQEILNYKIPHLHDGLGFNFLHYLYEGYFVLLPDLEYEIGNVGKVMSQSVVAATKEAGKYGNIDRSNMAVIGGSFGGYESTFLMGTTNIFKTAVAGVAVVDLPRMSLSYFRNYNQPEFWRVERQQHRLDRGLFGNWQLYLEESPIYHLPKVTQPILLWCGTEDLNVNPDQSRAYFLGLQRLGKMGILLEYEGEGHNILEKNKQHDLNVKVWEWLEYFLKGKTPAPWITPLIKKAVP